MHQLQSLEQGDQKIFTQIFTICENIFKDVVGHKMYACEDKYSGYHQVKIDLETQLKTTFIRLWNTFCYT